MGREYSRASVFRLVSVAWLVGVLGFAALMGLSLFRERDNRENEAQREIENVTRVLEEHALSTIQKVDLVLRDVQWSFQAEGPQANGGIGSRHGQTLNALLKRKIASIPEAEVIHIANDAGDYVFSSLDAVPVINISDRSFFQAHQKNPDSGLVISQPLVSRTLGTWVITLSRRINSDEGRFAGVVNIILQLDSFEKFYASLDMGMHGAVLMRDAEMRLLARYPRLESNMGRAIPEHPVAGFQIRGVRQGVYTEHSPADGTKRIYSFRRVGDHPLYVLAAIAEEDYLAEWWKHLYWYGIAGIVIALGLMVCCAR